MDRRPLGALLLMCVLLLQVGLLFRAKVAQPARIPLEIGATLPFRTEPLGDPLGTTARSDCRFGFVCTTTCPACSRLATRLGSAGGLDPVETPDWFVYGSRSEVRSWAEVHGVTPRRVFRLRPLSNLPLGRRTVGSIWFTPTRLILRGPDLEVRDARPSEALPSATEVARLCETGGIAPQSLSELGSGGDP